MNTLLLGTLLQVQSKADLLPSPAEVAVRSGFWAIFMLFIGCVLGAGLWGLWQRQRPILKPERRFRRIFGWTLLGLSFIIAGYASVQTAGQSYLGGFFLLLMAIATIEKYRVNPSLTPSGNAPPLSLKAFLPFLLGFTMIGVVLLLSQTLGGNSFGFWQISQYGDYFYYGEVAQALVETGREVAAPEVAYLSPEKAAASPYHYLDLWLGGLIHHISGLAPFLSIATAAPLVWWGLGMLGLAAMLEQSTYRHWSIWLFAGLGMVYMNFLAMWLDQLGMPHLFGGSFTPFAQLKHLPALGLGSAIALFCWQRHWAWASVVLMGCCLAATNWWGLFLLPPLGLLGGLYGRLITRLEAREIGVIWLLGLVWTAFFYGWLGKLGTVEQQVPPISFASLLSVTYLRTAINAFIVGMFNALLGLGPLFAVIGIYLWKRPADFSDRPTLIWALVGLVLLALVGSIMWGGMSLVLGMNADQFLNYVLILLPPLMLGLVLGLVPLQKSPRAMLLGLALIALLGGGGSLVKKLSIPVRKADMRYDHGFLNAAAQQQTASAMGALITETVMFDDTTDYVSKTHPRVWAPHQLLLFPQYQHFWPLNVPQMPPLESLPHPRYYHIHRNQRESDFFYQMWKARNEDDPRKSLEEIQSDIIHKNGIDWLVLSPKATVPSSLRRLVRLRLQDKRSGFQIVYLEADSLANPPALSAETL